MTRYNLTVPVTYTQNGEEKTRDDGTKVLSVKLDFPVGVTELVGFIPKAKDDDQPIED